MTKRKIQYWVIPPESDSEFVASMEDILDLYSMPYNASKPVVCMDEQPVQLLNETRASIVGTKEHPQRVDYEYERAGVRHEVAQILVVARQQPQSLFCASTRRCV